MEKEKNSHCYGIVIRKPGTEFRSREDDSQYISSLKQSQSDSIKQTVTSGLDTSERQAVTGNYSRQKAAVNRPEQRINIKERRENADSAESCEWVRKQEIRKPVNSFQSGPVSQMKDSKEPERATAGKDSTKQENTVSEKCGNGPAGKRIGNNEWQEMRAEIQIPERQAKEDRRKENADSAESREWVREQEIRKPVNSFQNEPVSQMKDSKEPERATAGKDSAKQENTVSEKCGNGPAGKRTGNNEWQEMRAEIQIPERQAKEDRRKENADSAESREWVREQEIRKPVNSFQSGPVSQMKDSKEPERATAGKKDFTKQENTAQKKQENELAELYEKPCINDIIDAFIEQKMFMCMNGKRLFLKEDGAYVSISISPEFELMKMKDLLKKNGMKLRFSEYSVIIRHLKTEPEIWVKDLETDGTGKYGIVFHDGSKLSGVEGEFSDFVVQGQIKNKLKPFTEGILLFVRECCVIEGNARTESVKLFGAYENFMYEYPDFLTAKLNQFVPYLKKQYGLQAGSTGKARVLKGIYLKNFT